MRKFILISAIVLASGAANAAATRDLSSAPAQAVDAQKPYQQAERGSLPSDEPRASEKITSISRADARPAETAPVEAKPAEAKPVDAKPNATRPAEKSEAPKRTAEKPASRQNDEAKARKIAARYGISW